MDSDDLIKVDTIELLVCYCEKYDAEIGISWFCSFYSDSQSDAPLAAIADHAFLVKGDRLLPWTFPV